MAIIGSNNNFKALKKSSKRKPSCSRLSVRVAWEKTMKRNASVIGIATIALPDGRQDENLLQSDPRQIYRRHKAGLLPGCLPLYHRPPNRKPFAGQPDLTSPEDWD